MDGIYCKTSLPCQMCKSFQSCFQIHFCVCVFILFYFIFLNSGYLDVFGCVFGSRTPMSGFLRK
uniref:Uncharacterized protein n=3 Tax=Cercopithecinae TaxID=9528 RepID=A0A2K5XN58_MANLE|nr:unnamed protein product [Macaca fascicularis]